jgi:hypothetical protein
LRDRIPSRGTGAAVDRVVEGLGAAAISRRDRGASVNQLPPEGGFVGRGGDVQRGVPGVYVVADLVERYSSAPCLVAPTARRVTASSGAAASNSAARAWSPCAIARTNVINDASSRTGEPELDSKLSLPAPVSSMRPHLWRS